MSPSGQSKQKRTNTGLLVIGIFKLLKSTLLLGLGIGLVYGRNQDLGQVASQWINTLWIGRQFVDNLLSKLSAIDERTLKDVAAGSFVYSVLLLVEGIGLCREKRWAELLTVAITASLLPFEFYELFHHLTAIGVFITVVNIAILWYLLLQLMRDHRHEGSSNAPPSIRGIGENKSPN
jgi:uncharacterized membrane protein (DUF2068 family)